MKVVFKSAPALMLVVLTLMSCTYHNDRINYPDIFCSNNADSSTEQILQDALNRYNAAKSRGDHLRSSGVAAAIAGIYSYRSDSANYAKWRAIHDQEANAYFSEEKNKDEEIR